MLRLHNTLTKSVQVVQPSSVHRVGMYTCGPTVYRDAHIGNLRSYLMADWIRRALDQQGVATYHVKNITDVGHMRQEMLERGEDKVVAAAIAQGKSPEEIAQFYTDRFLEDERKLNISRAQHIPKATDHIPEMLEIIGVLVDKGYAYAVEGNVYFGVSQFPDYGKLSGNIHQEELLEAVRVEDDPLKRDPRDFTLWKHAEPGRELKWPSPWGDGFPGWHIECSAMSIKYLGRRFEIHTGGVDNIFPHHEGEIAQSEGFTGTSVVDLWVHGQHLVADGVKMAKSTGNSFILADVEAQGIDPLAFRYLCLTARYRTKLNFTFTALKAAQRALLRLRNRLWEWSAVPTGPIDDRTAIEAYRDRFFQRVNDNLDLPGAVALTWEVARSDWPPQVRRSVILEFDEVLGLGLANVGEAYRVPEEVHGRLQDRAVLRCHGNYSRADEVRAAIERMDYVVEDTPHGTRVRPKIPWEKKQEAWSAVSSSAEVPSLIDEVSQAELTIGIVACNYMEDVKRCIGSVHKWLADRQAELVLVDNGSTDGTAEWLEAEANSNHSLRVIHADHVLGEAAAKNLILKQSRGDTVVLLDTSVEIAGDIFGSIIDMLADDTVGVVGPFGLRTTDLRHFHEGEGESGDMDAMQAYCFAFQRVRLRQTGLMREGFRFYRNLDLDYSFQFKDAGYRIVADPTLSVRLHEHRVWSGLAEGERDAMSIKNYRRFLKKWGDRQDLLVST